MKNHRTSSTKKIREQETEIKNYPIYPNQEIQVFRKTEEEILSPFWAWRMPLR